MKLSKRNTVVASIAAIAALGLGGIAFAATGGSNERATAFAEALSEQTGSEVTADDVIAAQKEVAKDRVEQAVADGNLTREQADEILERIENGERVGRGFGGAGGHHRGGGFGGPASGVAEALGLDADAVREALRDGQSLSEYAESQGKTRAEVVDAIKKSITERITERGGEAPTDAELTEKAEAIADGERGGKGFGRRGHGHGPGGFPDAPEEEEQQGENAALIS